MSSPASGPRRPWLALALTVPMPTIGTVAAFGLWPGPIGGGIYWAVKLFAMTLPLWWMVWVDRERWGWSPARHGGFGLAFVVGLLMSGAIWAAYAIAGEYLIDAEALRRVVEPSGLLDKRVFIAGALFWITVNSVLEEYLFRWFMYRQLAARLPRWAAIAGSALAFTVHHGVVLSIQFNATVGVLGAIACFTGAAVWSCLYVRNESIWPGWLSHAVVDVAIFTLGWIILFE